MKQETNRKEEEDGINCEDEHRQNSKERSFKEKKQKLAKNA